MNKYLFKNMNVFLISENMRGKHLLVLGYFGYRTGQLDGQTIKTRNVYELLNLNAHCSVDFFDTQEFKYSKLSPFLLLAKLFKCTKVFYLPAHNNLKYIFPLLFFLSYICRFSIVYIVIGGWLVDNLKNKWLHRLLLSHICGILPENLLTIEELRMKYHFCNVYHLPNFRIHSFVPSVTPPKTSFRIVFMSRIMRMKGIDVVFSLAEYVKNNYLKETIEIDFYGPIYKEDETYFYRSVEEFDFVRYKGELLPCDINRTLHQYDLLILPTRFYTEGFPGAILDAYISHIPVLVSNWKYAHEYVDDGKTGFICDLSDLSTFYHAVDYLYGNKDVLEQFKKNAKDKGEEYSSSRIWKKLEPFI